MTKVSSEPGVLRVALDWEVDVIDPPASFGGWNTGRVVQQMFESLVEDDLHDERASPTRIVPALAEAVAVSEDRLTYDFKLRANVRFHDGAPFDAAAAKFNYDRMWDPSAPQFSAQAADYNRIGLEAIAAVEVVTSHDLRIRLNEPFAEFLRYMTQEDAPGAQTFISPEALTRYGNDGIGDRAPGTGPFRFARRFDTPGGSAVEIVRSEDYWGGAPALEGIRFLPFPDGQARLEALLSGSVDVAYGLDAADLVHLRARGFDVRSGAVPYVWYFVFNMRDPVLADVRVRRAIAHAFDRERLSRTAFRGNTRPAAGMLPPASPAYDPAFVDPYPYDPERARGLLAEAGVPAEWSLKAVVAAAGSAQLNTRAICEALRVDLAAVGLRLEVDYRADWVDYCNEWRAGMPDDVGLSEMSWGMSCDVWLEQVLHGRNCSPFGFNTGRFSDPEADRLLDLARRTLSDAERIELYRAAHRRIMEQLPALPVLTVQDGALVSSPRVLGLKHARQNWHSFERVTLLE